MDPKKIANQYKQEISLENKRDEFEKRDVLKNFFVPQEHNPRTWGVKSLDSHFKNPLPMDFVLLLGEPGIGKTSFCLHMAIENSKKDLRVLFISLEMPAALVQERYITTYAAIEDSQRVEIEYSTGQLEKMKECKSELENKNLSILDYTHFKNPRDFNEMKQVMKEYDMIFIDNFSLIVSRGSREVEEQGKASEEIIGFVNEHKKTVVLLHHYAKKGRDKRGLEARGNQKLIDDLTVHASIGRDVEINDNLVYFRILKNRYRNITGVSAVNFSKGKYI